ncbi:MAG: hypothetical protein HN580_27490 [Deltaproteobacteria bacterium]|jgi:hypothetical protein|nr:hypothetical protein [Deltaproteobacteria bacterium]MBT4089084.1 hypothetical protein [Deltaproteobacteria bacterium]MBT4266936.1 hypothetical protein [Deltaproteobacteria bacterium]MBT4637454.1 hypothetical protein [Deltaproteobacteria bacterium]MBT6502803.1 hypothetical protein [Deltaproteobacteria bacterium]
MLLKTRDAKTSLKKKGFVQDKKDHFFYYYHYKDKKITSIRTKVSHGAREIDDGLIAMMSRQTKLTKKKFVDLIDCHLSKEDYLKHLLDSKLIPEGQKN